MTDNFPLNPDQPLRFLAACPAYAPTPLTPAEIAGRRLWLKDESRRMGLGAFKALGGVYAVAQLVSRHLGDVAPGDLTTDAARARAAGLTFVCASAGNHGMAVAAGARIFGAGARIHLAATVPEGFADRLRGKGAQVVRSGAVYEEAVQAAIRDAEVTGAVHLADGSWPGYTEPPRLVMEGYTVIAGEMRDAFRASGEWPSHVYLQAGVGGLAAAIAGMIRRDWNVQPEIVVVEPDAAPCLKASVAAGRIVEVAGPESTMGRLDCKLPSMLAYDILRHAADRFVTVSDAAAEAAADQAGAAGFPTTPSGAAGLAALLAEAQAPANPLVILSEGPVAG